MCVGLLVRAPQFEPQLYCVDLVMLASKNQTTEYAMPYLALDQSLIVNWLRLKCGAELLDGKCVVRNIRIR